MITYQNCGKNFDIDDNSNTNNGGGGPLLNKSIKLAWNIPLFNVDGSPLIDLSGFTLHYGNQSGEYSKSIDVGNKNSITLQDLSSGAYYVVVESYDLLGNFSDLSEELHFQIQ